MYCMTDGALDTVEGDTARGTTTLVYLQLHISLYTGTVHVLRRLAGVRSAYRIKLKSRKYGAQLALRGCVIK